MLQPSFNLQLVTGATEVLIAPSNARLIAIIPQGTASGTVTVREASAVGTNNAARWTAPSSGTTFGSSYGVKFMGGLSVQLSNAADVFGVIWGPSL